MRPYLKFALILGLLAALVIFAEPLSGAGEQCYVGTATTTITRLDERGTVQEEKAFEVTVELVVGDPAEFEGTVESNPFNLLIGPYSPEDAYAEGDFNLWTAMAFRDWDNAGFLAQYWTVKSPDGLVFKGTLTETHSAESLVNNLVWFEQDIAGGLIMLMPSMMAEGTRMRGTFSDDFERVSLLIFGEAGFATRFTIEIEADAAPC